MAAKYKLIYKPHHPDSNPQGCVREHRYIYHIYLSIKYNRIIYLPKGYDIHHKNGDKLDNRIENLELIAHSKHTVLSNQLKGTKHLDKVTICLECKSDKTLLYKKQNYEMWYKYKDGYLCRNCYRRITRKSL